MNRILIASIVVTITIGAGTYYVFTKTDLIEHRTETTIQQPPPTTSTEKPLHGDFHKRFQPTLPSSGSDTPR